MPNVLEPRDPESRHFGIRIAAAHPENAAAVTQAVGTARTTGVQLLVCRVPVHAVDAVHALQSHGQLCDTLVYLERSFAEEPTAPNLSARHVRAADSADSERIVWIAARGFRDYVGHWHADARLSRDLANGLYIAWARDICEGTTADPHRVFVLEQEGQVVAFAAYRSAGEACFDLVLGAVDPAYQGQGVYGSLVEAANAWLYHNVCLRRAVYSTHLSNYATLRAVCRMGYLPVRAVYTFHVWL